MSLADLLESQFRGDIRFRGAAYIEAERVSIIRVTPENIFGSVRDGGEYQTQLTRAEDKVLMYCTCDRYQKSGVCKHLWGSVLAADAAGFVSDSIRPGHIPPFASEPEPLKFEDDLDDLTYGEPWSGPTGGGAASSATSAKISASKVEVRLRPWETQLKSLREEIDAAGDDKKQREREIFYEIDIEESRTEGHLVIQTSQRQRRADGQWGKFKALKVRPGKKEPIEHEDDQRILAYLSGALPERSNWYARQAEVQTAVYRYGIPYELSELILPLICQTGRLRYLNSSERDAIPLEWDDTGAWELTMGIEKDEEEKLWRLIGHLRRGEEQMDFKDAQLVVSGGLMLTETKISRMHDFDAFDWVKLLDESNRLEVPDGEEQDLVDQLLDMPVLPRLNLPEELRLEEVDGEPLSHLVIQTPKGQRLQRDRLQGEIMFDYMGSMVSGSSARWAIVQRENKRCILRNREMETEAWGQLTEAGFRRMSDRRQTGHDVEIPARDLGRAVRGLIEHGWRVRADDKQIRQAGEIQFRVQSGIDWFDLDAKVDFEGQSVSFPELLSALSRGDTTVRLDDGSLGIIPEHWLQQFGMLTGLGVVEEDNLRFSNNQVALLDAMLSAQDDVVLDEGFVTLRDQFKNFDGIKAAKDPVDFKGELREYQREGLGWMQFLQDFHFGGCLADDMGLGKTIQLIALMLERRTRSKEKLPPAMVVVPKSLLFNWQQECEKFAPKLNTLEYTGLDRAANRDKFNDNDIIITTYGTLRRDIMSLKDMKFDYIVLDEAQTIKNSSSQVAKATRLLSANFRLALSGTPIENHMGDLWSIFEFLNPGMLGRSSAFRGYANDSTDEESRKVLAAGLRPFILRRTKEQVASELPEKMEETLYCEMGEEQRARYDELRVHYRQSLLGMVKEQGLAKSKMHVLEALLRLRQAACHPALLDKKEETYGDPSAKLDVLIPHIEELISEGHKALVFSQFTSMLSIVRHHLDAKGITYQYLDGKTRNRKDVVEKFQNDDDCGLFLISLKAGGLGLNLTSADYVFLLDPWWNPAVEAQAIDRAHRVGQTRTVFAYRMICRDTVEEKIAKLQEKKRKLADAILQADNTGVLKDLSTDDLEMLLS